MFEDTILNSENKENESSNDFYISLLKKWGIFAGFLTAAFLISLLFTYLGRSSWEKSLRKNVEKVYSTYSENKYKVGDYIKVKTPLMTNVAVYSLSADDMKEDDEVYAVIARIPTLYGPVAAVYHYDSQASDSASFIDFANVSGEMKEKVANAAMNSQIEYWSKKIPKIISLKIVEKK